MNRDRGLWFKVSIPTPDFWEGTFWIQPFERRSVDGQPFRRCLRKYLDKGGTAWHEDFYWIEEALWIEVKKDCLMSWSPEQAENEVRGIYDEQEDEAGPEIPEPVIEKQMSLF